MAPETLPTTLSGWLAALVLQLGEKFTDFYIVSTALGATEMISTAENVTGKKCGEILRYVCMAAGAFPRADGVTGKLLVETLPSVGGDYLTLDNLVKYPTMKANDDLSLLIFKRSDGVTQNISGNSSAADKTITVNNPFIATSERVLAVARAILSCYGGNRIETQGRGNMASELGDVDSVQLSASVATSARRLKQQIKFVKGVMKDIPSTLLQADGSFLYEDRAIITASGTWTAPAGVTSLRIIIVGGGNGGGKGTDGGWNGPGTQGETGIAGRVFAATINCNEQQSFAVVIGGGGAANGGTGTDTTFGVYTSTGGELFNGYTDIANGDVFGRNGVALPLSGSGDGGKGGDAGQAGQKHTETVTTTVNGEVTNTSTVTVIDAYPTPGGNGAAGASGCVIVYYDKP